MWRRKSSETKWCILPKQVGEEDEQSECHAQPEPGACEMTAQWGERHRSKDAGNQEEHGVFGHQAEADECAYCQPPSRIPGIQKPHDAVRDCDPPQIVE